MRRHHACRLAGFSIFDNGRKCFCSFDADFIISLYDLLVKNKCQKVFFGNIYGRARNKREQTTEMMVCSIVKHKWFRAKRDYSTTGAAAAAGPAC